METHNGVTKIARSDIERMAKEMEILTRCAKSDEEISDSLKASVSLQVWGHGESGYVVTVFGSYNEAEARRAAELVQWLIDAAREAGE